MLFAKNTILYGISTGLTKGLPFLMLPFLTRVLSADDFGTLGIALVLVGIASILIGFNPFILVIARFYNVTKNQLAGYVRNILMIVVVTCLILMAVGIGTAGWISQYGVSQGVILLVLATALFRVLLNLGLTIRQMEHNAVVFFSLSIVVATGSLGLTSFMLLYTDAGWPAVLGAELLTTAGVVFFLLRRLAADGYINGELNFKHTSEVLRFSIPLVPHVLALWLMNSIDRFFLAEMTDMRTVGLYSTAYTIGLGISLVHEALQRAWQPYFFQIMAGNCGSQKQAVVRYTWWYYIGSILLLIVYLGILSLTLPLIVGPEYIGATEYIPMIAISYTLFGMYRVIASHLYLNDRTILLASITALAAVVNVVGNIVLIPKFGAIGAAQATVMSFGILFIVVKMVVVREGSLHWFGSAGIWTR